MEFVAQPQVEDRGRQYTCLYMYIYTDLLHMCIRIRCVFKCNTYRCIHMYIHMFLYRGIIYFYVCSKERERERERERETDLSRIEVFNAKNVFSLVHQHLGHCSCGHHGL